MPMTLDETLLRKLDAWTPQTGRDTLAFADPAASVQLTVEQVESLSCRIWELRVSRPLSGKPEEALAAWAKRVAATATGLMEPLHLLEVDAVRGAAVLRSNKPAQKSEDLFYYEVLLDQTGSANVRRYQASYGNGKRKQVAFVLTREAVAKLAADLAV
jgi:hypothetical protein